MGENWACCNSDIPLLQFIEFSWKGHAGREARVYSLTLRSRMEGRYIDHRKEGFVTD